MAEKGGYRRPKDRSVKASGVGKNSKRTDGGQAIKSPNVQDSTDLQVGDRERIRQGQKIAPLSQTPSPSVSAPPSGVAPTGGGGVGMSELPPHIFEMPSNRPMEPETEGLPFGPGGGPEVLQSYQAPDDRELLLRFLAKGGNEDAHRMLQGIVDSKRPPEMPPPRLLSPIEEDDAPLDETTALPDDEFAPGADEPADMPDEEALVE